MKARCLTCLLLLGLTALAGLLTGCGTNQAVVFHDNYNDWSYHP